MNVMIGAMEPDCVSTGNKNARLARAAEPGQADGLFYRLGLYDGVDQTVPVYSVASAATARPSCVARAAVVTGLMLAKGVLLPICWRAG